MNSFYTAEELAKIGFKKYGKNVLISRKVSIYGAAEIVIGSNVRIDDFCILSGCITIGDFVHVAAYVALFAGNAGIELQDYSGISSRTAIYAVSDDYSGEAMTNPTIPDEFRMVTGGKVCVQKHGLVGTGCTVLPDVTIGEGSSVGAMSLVSRNLPAWGMYVGVPAKWIKDRSKNLLCFEAQLLAKKDKNNA